MQMTGFWCTSKVHLDKLEKYTYIKDPFLLAFYLNLESKILEISSLNIGKQSQDIQNLHIISWVSSRKLENLKIYLAFLD